uniref:poly(ADP-ribose) glycohydrolase n=1 Tax=Toxoplasma gondii COUG TaxID=1074873 RepID=A0A2G8YDY2_TOXGO|nr:poly(ADP-ribose) glycohydrolase [Toxoplasma gondii COUG]
MKKQFLLFHQLPPPCGYWQAASAVLRRYLAAYYPSAFEASRRTDRRRDEREVNDKQKEREVTEAQLPGAGERLPTSGKRDRGLSPRDLTQLLVDLQVEMRLGQTMAPNGSASNGGITNSGCQHEEKCQGEETARPPPSLPFFKPQFYSKVEALFRRLPPAVREPFLTRALPRMMLLSLEAPRIFPSASVSSSSVGGSIPRDLPLLSLATSEKHCSAFSCFCLEEGTGQREGGESPEPAAVELTAGEGLALLSLAFFSILPPPNLQPVRQLPDPNFMSLFEHAGNDQLNKLHCYIRYFIAMTTAVAKYHDVCRAHGLPLYLLAPPHLLLRSSSPIAEKCADRLTQLLTDEVSSGCAQLKGEENNEQRSREKERRREQGATSTAEATDGQREAHAKPTSNGEWVLKPGGDKTENGLENQREVFPARCSPTSSLLFLPAPCFRHSSERKRSDPFFLRMPCCAVLRSLRLSRTCASLPLLSPSASPSSAPPGFGLYSGSSSLGDDDGVSQSNGSSKRRRVYRTETGTEETGTDEKEGTEKRKETQETGKMCDDADLLSRPLAPPQCVAVTMDSLADREDPLLPLQEFRENAEAGKGIDSAVNLEIMADFANQWIGGGALYRGCVQEEIFFATHPELLLLRLFQQRLAINESCAMSGAMQFSRYSGYADSFTCLFNSTQPHSLEKQHPSCVVSPLRIPQPTWPWRTSPHSSSLSPASLSSPRADEPCGSQGHDGETAPVARERTRDDEAEATLLEGDSEETQGVEDVDARPLLVFLHAGNFTEPPGRGTQKNTEGKQEQEETLDDGEGRDSDSGKKDRDNRDNSDVGGETQRMRSDRGLPKRVVGIEVCSFLTALDAQRYAGVAGAGGGEALMPSRQFEAPQMLREVNKVIAALSLSPEEDAKYTAYLQWAAALPGSVSTPDRALRQNEERDRFSASEATLAPGPHQGLVKRPFATGNWGCGVFKGDPQLKFLLQWLAASLVGRRLIYHAHSRPELVGSASRSQRGGTVTEQDASPRGEFREPFLLQSLADLLIKKEWTVGKLWRSLVKGSLAGNALSKGPFNYIGQLALGESTPQSL